MNKIIILLILTSTSLFAEVNIFDNMDEETAVRTGISKLSSEEKLALIKWIEGSSQQSKEQMEKQVRLEVTEQITEQVTKQVTEEVTEKVAKKERKKFIGFSIRESDRVVIKSTVVGEMNGWTGKSVIKLANGQVWKQVDSVVMRTTTRTNPSITIKPKSLSSWTLYIDGLNRGIKVRRIR